MERRRATPAQRAGDGAEERAASFLQRHGVRIVARNYRTRLGEIDLVGYEGGTLVFVEVRLRSGSRFGGGAESVDLRKQRRIVMAARHFLMALGREPPCRFDVVSLQRDAPTWIRGAFEVG
ncbi:MAG: YraN family protein [Betaproteobacteria bacterium]